MCKINIMIRIINQTVECRSFSLKLTNKRNGETYTKFTITLDKQHNNHDHKCINL